MLDALLEADAGGAALMPLVDPPAVDAPRPDRIGNYDVIDMLGAGAMGEVYRARDTRLGRDVAIKVLRDAAIGESDRLARFEREARVLASLNHPHLAHVYGLEAVGESPALVIELVEGPTLAEVSSRQRSGGLTISEALRIAAQIADGLSAAHERGIVHRDLKPGNIALTAGGSVKVLDFGIAKRLTEPELAGMPGQTIAGTLLGTPAYMSPEQARAEPCDQRADIWAFGCLLVELLTGRSPFARPTASESLAAVLEHTPDLTTLPRGTPDPVRTLIRHCLDKDPQRRLRDIADARLILEDAAGGEASAPAHGRRATFVGVTLAAGIVCRSRRSGGWPATFRPSRGASSAR
jgi:serine/threonine protein kinase